MPAEVRTIKILLVEDNPGDVRLTIEAFREGKLSNELIVASDGEEALNLLMGTEIVAPRARPDLILLDLNLPKIDGRDVLARIKGHQDLRRIPVVVLTTSDLEQDILKTYDMYANCYIKKPVDLAQFMKVVNSIEDFWLSVVKLPTK